MKKIINYFISTTGGNFVWQHINRDAIQNYLLYSSVLALIAVFLSIFISQVFYLIFFLLLSCFLLITGISAFHIDAVKNYILKPGSTTEDAKYTLFFFIYIGASGLIITIYTLLKGPVIKI